ncbi:hypothetical protein [Streptomyces sp. 2A115]|uniref:hypothetical protein n=1 Tax=Streptomyces sp. 2A115 TaxID=3457439 RepID=UPI003FD5A79C
MRSGEITEIASEALGLTWAPATTGWPSAWPGIPARPAASSPDRLAGKHHAASKCAAYFALVLISSPE